MSTATKRERKDPPLETLSFKGEIVLCRMGKEGDKRLVWDASDLAQLHEAREKFYELLDQGYYAYAVDPESGQKTDKKILEFPAQDEEVLLLTFEEMVKATKKGKKVVAHPAPAAG